MFLFHLHTAPRTIQTHNRMFSHVVIFWTDPTKPNATADLLAGAEKYLKPIPGVLAFPSSTLSISPTSATVAVK